MENLIGLLIPIFIFLFIIKKLKGETVPSEDEAFLPYRRRQFLMTKAEYAFNKVLEQAVGDRYYISRQVPLSNLVEVIDSYKWNKSWRSKIDKKTIDFVLFEKKGYTPYLAIELDDSSHYRSDRQERDRFVANVLQKAGIRLQRVKNAYSYDIQQIAGLL